MNTGQTMLVIAAFALLSALTLAVNSTMITSSTMGYEIQANLNALSIAQSMLDEVMTRSYDERTVGTRVFSYAGMTATASFGPDAGETFTGIDSVADGNFLSKSKFDDVDDYHLYDRRAFDVRMGWYTVVDSVVYVEELNPTTISGTPTWHKRVSVTITHPYMSKRYNGDVIPFYLQDISVYRQYF